MVKKFNKTLRKPKKKIKKTIKKKKSTKKVEVNVLYKRFLKTYTKSERPNKDKIFSKWVKEMGNIDKKYNSSKYKPYDSANNKIINERIEVLNKYAKILK